MGASKLGGCPDMPPMEEWPRFRSNPLSFIGQVNLSDIARYRTFTHFPPEGLLLFFYDADTQPRASEELEPGSAQVLYLAAGLPLLRRVAPEDLYEELQYPPASIEFIEDMTLPGMDAAFDSEAPDAGPPDLSDEQFEAFERLMDAVEDYRQEDNQPMHRMFGFPDGWQDAMYLSGDYLGATDGTPEDCYRMLLQVDSDEGWNEESPEGMFWGSGGRIHFWINRSDLLRGRFGDVELILQCT